MSDQSSDAPCTNCSEMVVGESQALQCDLCDSWVHIACLGISEEAYKIYGEFGGQLPWFCSGCRDWFKSQRCCMDRLRSENSVLRVEVAQLKDAVEHMHRLQEVVDKLTQDMSFLTSHEPSNTLPANPSNLPPICTHAC